MKETVIKLQKKLGVTADGIFGPKTLAALADKLGAKIGKNDRETTKNIQARLGVTADGIFGPKTLQAALTIDDTIIVGADNLLVQKYIHKPVEFSKVEYNANPLKQSSIRMNTTIYGKAGNESNLVNVPVPENYPLKYAGKPVKSIRVHKLAADRLEAALKDIINHYGEDIEKVAPGACVYDGSYNFRKTRNSSSQSIHSWGLAIDFDAANNGLKTPWSNARFSQPIYKPFLDILEHHGWLSLGRRSGKDRNACSNDIVGLRYAA